MPSDDGADRLGVLRLRIEGGWTVAEMSGLLATLDRAYLHVASTLVVDEWPDRYGRRIPWDWMGPFVGRPDDYVAGLRLRASVEFGNLRVHRSEYASPGVIEAIAGWRPLKSLVDLVTNWRDDNTDRARLREEGRQFDENMARQRTQDDRAYWLEVFDRVQEAPPEWRDAMLPRLFGEIPQLTRAIASEIRVEGIEVIELAGNDHQAQ